MTALNQIYKIERDYVTSPQSRVWDKAPERLFIVAHDTGNPGSTAKGNRNYFTSTTKGKSSAHTFIDDNYILEIIPLDEKAWHVNYQRPEDNELYGDDANDVAVGVELCYGGAINFAKAYDRYVWYMAYLCKKYGLHPQKHIIGHITLDPARRTDPINAFSKNGKTWSGFIADVMAYFTNWNKDEMITPPNNDLIGTSYKVVSGDTLYGIGRRFKVSVENLMSWNKLKDTSINPGDVLTITKPVPPAPAKPIITSPRFDLPVGVFNVGDKGIAVTEIQKALVALYFYPDRSKANGGVDGDYGAKTKDAVTRFQSMYIPNGADGVYGKVTRSKMIELLKKEGKY